MTDRGTARHRAPSRATTPLSTLSTGMIQVVGDRAETLTRTGAVLAVSTGLVASFGLQANATTADTPALDPQTASIPAVPAGAALSSPLTATVVFDKGALTRVNSRAALKAQRSAARSAALLAARSVSNPAAPAVKPATAAAAKTAVKATAKTTVKTSSKAATSLAARAASKTSAPASAATTPLARGAAVLSVASRYVGIKYRFGGTTPRGFDCSGYSQYVYKQMGVSLPRTAAAQRAATTRIPRSQARPGDLVFFHSGGRVYHMGIYAGGNMMYDSPRSGKSVTKRKIWSSNVTFGRVSR